MGDSESEHWLGLLSESEERLAEVTDSPDPVAQRQIVEALYSKGKALSTLDRPSEAIAVWDELLRRLAVEPSGGTQPVVLRALLGKAIDLDSLGEQAQAIGTADALLALSDSVEQSDLVRSQVLGSLLLKLSAVAPEELEAAAAVNEEIVRRFADSDHPLLHEQVTSALVRLGALRLLQNRAEDAVEIGRRLADRFENAPEEALAAEADLANIYGRSLTGFAGTDPRGIAEALAFVFVHTATWLGSVVVERLSASGVEWLITPLRRASRAYGIRVTPARWKQARRQIQAAIELQGRVISRIDTDPDPELQRAATVARIQTASAWLVLGNLRRWSRELNPVFDSSDPATVQALQTLAAGLRERSDLPGQIEEVATLSLRAQALGQGDTKIQQVAYEDSIEPLLADTNRRSVRWLAALLRPEQHLLTEISSKAKAAASVLRRRSLR